MKGILADILAALKSDKVFEATLSGKIRGWRVHARLALPSVVLVLILYYIIGLWQAR